MYAVNDGLGQGGLPQINLASVGSLYLPNTSGVLTLHLKSCNGSPFHGTKLLNCAALAPAIKKCQSKGKIVTLSIGGADTGNMQFKSDSEAEQFADTVWNLFLGGTPSNSTRPFGSAVLDGCVSYSTVNGYKSRVLTS